MPYTVIVVEQERREHIATDAMQHVFDATMMQFLKNFISAIANPGFKPLRTFLAYFHHFNSILIGVSGSYLCIIILFKQWFARLFLRMYYNCYVQHILIGIFITQ